MNLYSFINGSMVRVEEDDNLFQNTYDSNIKTIMMDKEIKDEKDVKLDNIKLENDAKKESHDENNDENQEIDILISNVVCTFSVRCHLNLREIAMNGSNVEYKRENGLVRMKLRKPSVLATISSTGKITCTGAQSNLEAKQAARRCARSLQKLGFKVKFENYRIVNVLGSCTLPWAVKIEQLSQDHRDKIQYEPEIQPGAIYKINDIKATVRIFSTGSVTVTAPSVNAVQASIETIYPLVLGYRRKRSAEEHSLVEKKKMRQLIYKDDTNCEFKNSLAEEDSDENTCDSLS